MIRTSDIANASHALSLRSAHLPLLEPLVHHDSAVTWKLQHTYSQQLNGLGALSKSSLSLMSLHIPNGAGILCQ